MIELTSAEARKLKADAHHLNPIVLIGGKGLTEAVIAEVDKALDIHGLIKVKAHGGEKSELTAFGAQIANDCDCAFVGLIGRTLILYRPIEDS